MHGSRGGLGDGQQPQQPRNIELFEILIFFNGIKKPLKMLECITILPKIPGCPAEIWLVICRLYIAYQLSE